MPLLLLFLLPLTLHAQKMVTFYDKDEQFIKEEFFYRGKPTHKHGEYLRYFPSSKNVHIQTTYKHNHIHGLYREFYEEAGLKSFYTYKHGHKDGVYKKFYPTGQLEVLATYKNDKLIGEMKRFYSNKMLKAQLHFKHGKRTDTLKVYYPNGRLQQFFNYRADQRQGGFAVYDTAFNLVQTGTYEQDRLHGEILNFYPNQTLHKRIHFKGGLIDGKMEIFYPDGTLQEETDYVANAKQGFSRLFYRNGNKKFVAYYEADKIARFQTSYHPNEQLKRNFKIEIIGEETGAFKTYDSLGQLTGEGYLLQGFLHRENKAYYGDGTLKHHYHYDKGQKKGLNTSYYPTATKKTVEKEIGNRYFEIERYYPNQKLKSKSYLKNAKHVGQWTYFFENGHLKRTENYKNGLLEGEQKEYYDTATKTLKRRLNYSNGKMEGIERKYYLSGNLKSEKTYQNDIIKGLVKTYFENGILKSIGNQYKNKKVGTWKYYDIKGKVIRQELYRNGKLVPK